MRRREFLYVGGAAVLGWPLPVGAQLSVVPVVGFLNSAAPAEYARELAAFIEGLKQAGYNNGENVNLEYRWANGDYSHLSPMAADLVRRRVSVIVANGPAVQIAKNATSDIPIVFTAGFDPIRLGLVTSLSRPGANITGISIMNVEIAPKRLELLRELMPAAKKYGFLINPANPNASVLLRDLETAAQTLGVSLFVVRAKSDEEIRNAFKALVKENVAALVIGNDPFLTTRSRLLADLAIQHKIPAAYQYREFAAEGGLLSYGASLIHTYKLAGAYVGRILKGERPTELPILQSTNIELIINLKTAKALNLVVPLPLLGRADEVIE